jgi:hypothetical protein
MGSLDSKVGITGSPTVRLGVYQNSYSKKSHTACFDVVYIGPARVIGNLEKTAKQDQIKAIWTDRGFASWTFDEATCMFQPPVPRPDDFLTKQYNWDESILSWVAVTTTT